MEARLCGGGYGCRPTADQISTACRPLMGVWIEILQLLTTCGRISSPLTQGRGLNERVQGVAGRLHTFLCERNFTFFLACVKYVYEVHRPALPSFSGFFALFGDGRCFQKSPLHGRGLKIYGSTIWESTAPILSRIQRSACSSICVASRFNTTRCFPRKYRSRLHAG